MKQTVGIVHFNTPELTEACILSLRKSGCAWPVVVLDNSDERPFSRKMNGVQVLDNTKGQIIDFEKELSKYPDREPTNARQSNFGSVKHCLSVQYLWQAIPEGFILLESDTLVKKDIRPLWKEEFAAVGEVKRYAHNPHPVADRYLPWLLYMNVPKLTKAGAKFFDPHRCWCLQKGVENPENWYDTGACLLEDVRRIKPQLVGLRIQASEYIDHYKGGSWQRENLNHQKSWLNQRKNLWYTPTNNDVKIFICQHADFETMVTNDVYELIDSRKGGDSDKGIPGPYFSELLHMHRVSRRKKLPKYIGFCQYRRYFDFLDNVPDIAALVDKYGAITTEERDLGMSMQDQYATWGNPDDLRIATEIICAKYPDFADAWFYALDSRKMHLGSLHIMRTDDWKEMQSVAWDVTQEYLKRIGGDIDMRVTDHPKDYHLDTFNVEYARRVGGQFCERIVSAWIDWKFPKAFRCKMIVTGNKLPSNTKQNEKAKTSKPKRA